MRLVTITARDTCYDAALGGLVCRDVPHPQLGQGVLFRKGEELTESALERLALLDGAEVRVLVPEVGDEPESTAAARLAAAVAGRGVRLDPPRHGQATLRADTRGWLNVHRETLERVNAFDGILVFTVPAERPAEGGDVIGAAKVAPLVIPRRVLEAVEGLCQTAGPVLEVVPFQRRRVALLVVDRIQGRALERAQAHLAAKLAWFGSTVDLFLPLPAEADRVAAALRQASASGAELILAAGGVSTDPADPLFEGLRAAGGSIEQVGVPIDPGTACWVGWLRTRPVIGLASCELFGRVTALDLLLPRILAGERLDRQLLRSLAYGGLLEAGPARVPDYGPPGQPDGEEAAHD